MELHAKFWIQVANDLEEKENKGHPSTWKRESINIFREKLRIRLEQAGKRDQKKAQLMEIENLNIISYDRFLKIFRKKEIGGKLFRNHFAIYLGTDSFDHYVERKGIRNKYYHTPPEHRLPPLPEYIGIEKPLAPYLGLETFSPEYCRLFFGRENDQERIINYLNEIPPQNGKKFNPHDLILLYGQSGVGKSSLLHAGILPRLLSSWDVHYERRQQNLGLPLMFKQAIKEKPRLILIENTESLFDLKNPKPPQLEIDAFVQFYQQISDRLSNTNLKIVLACDNKYIDQLEAGINSSNSSITPIKIIAVKTSTEAAYFTNLEKALGIKNIGLILTSSLGQKHNLYKKLYTRLQNIWCLQYCIRQNDHTLGSLLREKIHAPKRIIIFDQIEGAITKSRDHIQFPDEISEENKELIDLSNQIADFLNKNKDCKVILSFRENHLSSIWDIIEKRLGSNVERFFIKPLNEKEVRHAIEGPLESGLFHFKYYKGFIDEIIRILKEDQNSNIGPALQIIMKKLWDLSKNHNRYIDKVLLKKAVSTEGDILEHFLKEQLRKVNHFL